MPAPIFKHKNINLGFSPSFCIAAIFVLLLLQAILLHFFGQPLISASHVIMLWAGEVHSLENSQQLTDWYSFSHVIHGFLFYLALRFLFPKLTVWQRLVLAVSVEVGWELIENTPMVIQHYRLQALAQGYSGDSIINSLSDTCMMIIGFIAARRFPVWATVSLGIFFELWTGYWIHDGLTFNVLGFFWRPEFISRWQESV
jgi:hypothetical protein